MKKIAVFCGSSSGNDAAFEEQAYALGVSLAKEGIAVIYGGSKLGLMGAVANGAIHNQGNVIGILPHFLEAKEIAHKNLTELILVDTMLERKTKMNELCDGVITLPGGYGTMDELFEMLTWAQLGLHTKPIGILNTNGYYNELVALLNTMTEKRLLKAEYRDMVLVSETIEGLLYQMKAYEAPTVEKWIAKEDI